MDRKMAADIEKLTKMMMQLTNQHPEDTPLSYQSPLTEKFLTEAEKGGRRWFSFGFDEWLRAGQWWLMSAQGRLYSGAEGVIDLQPYADLLKASSILLDILPRHPSIRLWDPTKEYLQFHLLADMLKTELETIKTRGLQQPDLLMVEQADLRIWTDAVKTVQLEPSIGTSGSRSWNAATEETLFQGFGTFTYDRQVDPEECLILILVKKHSIVEARIVAQNQRGAELISLRIDFDLLKGRQVPGDPGPGDDNFSHWPHIDIKCADSRIPLGDGIRTIRLGHTEFSLASTDDLQEVSSVLRSLIICQNISGVLKDHVLLHSLILLLALDSRNRGLVKKALDFVENSNCVAYMAQETQQILTLAKSTSSGLLIDNTFRPLTDLYLSNSASTSTTSTPYLQEDSDVDSEQFQVIYFWIYAICANISLAGGKLDFLRPMKLPIYSCKSSIRLHSPSLESYPRSRRSIVFLSTENSSRNCAAKPKC